jgi:putative ABC transport system permease protein
MLSVMLLIGASLLIRTVAQLQQRELGFEPDGVLLVNLAPPAERYTDTDKPGFFADVLAGVRTVPGVAQAAVGGGAPPQFGLRIASPVAEGSNVSGDDIAYLLGTAVGPGYLPALGTRLIAGRDFTENEDPLSIIVNRAFVERFWPGQDGVGRRVKLSPKEWNTIVGVIDNIRVDGPLGRTDELQVFYPMEWSGPGFTLVVRASGAEPMRLLPAIRQVVARVDPQLPIRKAALFSDEIAALIARERFNMILLAIFAALALILSAVGVYGLVAYTVQQRVPEIGVRMALGAMPGTVRDLFLKQGMVLTVVGLVLGLSGAVAGATVMRSLVHGITPYDGVSFGLAVLVIGGTAFLASWLPARTAARIDPLVALRAE